MYQQCLARSPATASLSEKPFAWIKQRCAFVQSCQYAGLTAIVSRRISNQVTRFPRSNTKPFWVIQRLSLGIGKQRI